jgi:hypothetical protein
VADRIAADQFGVARGLRGLGGDVGLGPAQRRLGTLQIGGVRHRIDLEQALPGADVGAFAELAPEHQAVDPRAHLRHAHRVHAAGQVDGERHARRPRRRHRYRRRWR